MKSFSSSYFFWFFVFFFFFWILCCILENDNCQATSECISIILFLSVDKWPFSYFQNAWSITITIFLLLLCLCFSFAQFKKKNEMKWNETNHESVMLYHNNNEMSNWFRREKHAKRITYVVVKNEKKRFCTEF